MNILFFSALSLVSAGYYWEIPIYRDPTEIIIPTLDGYGGISYWGDSYYTQTWIDGYPYTTYLEPQGADIWIVEVESRKANLSTQGSVEIDVRRTHPIWDMGEYRLGRVNFHRNNFIMPYAVINAKVPVNNTRSGGLGLAPTNSSTFKFPMANGDSRDKYKNLADRIVGSGLAQSDAFTINLATNSSSEDKLVYGAMDLSRFTGKLKALYRSPSTGLINSAFTINGMNAKATFAIDGTNTYLADEIVVTIAQTFGAVWDPYYRVYTVAAMPQDEIILNFDGFELTIPPSYVWVQWGNRYYLTIRPLSTYTGSPRGAIIGSDILKSVYIVYDPRHNCAAIGQANRNPGPTKYEIIPPEGIPQKYLY